MLCSKSKTYIIDVSITLVVFYYIYLTGSWLNAAYLTEQLEVTISLILGAQISLILGAQFINTIQIV